MSDDGLRRVVLIVLDSVGIGEAPDAAEYGDAGAATLPHIGRDVPGGLRLPVLQSLGLGNIPALIPSGLPIPGVEPARRPMASYGAMRERSQGKDTITGHWEIAGLLLRPGFHLFPPGPPSFPPALVRKFESATGRRLIGNKAAGGTQIIEELGPEHLRSGALICYTSADSVFQIAAHVEIVPLPELYRACEIARGLCNPLRVGRVIARPFRGTPGAFERTPDRRDYAYEPPEATVLERLQQAGVPVYGVGKIEDIFLRRGIVESIHSGSTVASQAAVEALFVKMNSGLLFANFIDFDMQFGHRRDVAGYARALEQADAWLGRFLPRMTPNDTLILTADHGNDPTFRGTDHTREYVPLLAHRPGRPARSLGIRDGFYDVAAALAAHFRLPPLSRGQPFVL